MSTQVNTVLITGGSSGIGYDIARAFLEEKATVVLNGRNVKKLEAAAERLGHSDRLLNKTDIFFLKSNLAIIF